MFFGPSAPKPLCFSRIELVMKKRPSTANGLLLGVFFPTEGPQNKNIFDKIIQRLQTKALRTSNAAECQSSIPSARIKQINKRLNRPY
jgi:hypothetical protein